MSGCLCRATCVRSLLHHSVERRLQATRPVVSGLAHVMRPQFTPITTSSVKLRYRVASYVNCLDMAHPVELVATRVFHFDNGSVICQRLARNTRRQGETAVTSVGRSGSLPLYIVVTQGEETGSRCYALHDSSVYHLESLRCYAMP